jgi:cytochrome c551/c552
MTNLIVLVAGLGLAIFGIVVLVGGSGEMPTNALPKTRAEFLAAGEELVKQHNCNYCHRTDPPADHAPDRANCQQFHQLHNRPENLAPPLKHVAERRTEEWIRRYLRYPYPIRTSSHDRMPDLLLSDFEVEVLTGYLLVLAQDRMAELPETAPAREKSPDAARLARGKALWDKYACGTCHSLGEHKVAPQYGPNGVPLVPAVVFSPPLDRVWTRARLEWIAAAIRDPDKWLPWAGMTVEGITDADANELAWYVMNAVRTPDPAPTHNDVMGVLAGACNACHYGPQENASPATNPEGGAGWLATWSQNARKLDLTTYEGLRRGALDDLGRPRPAVVPYAENSPLIAHIEGWKQPRMPFGANPLGDEQIDIIRRWIMAGAPGPDVTDIPQRPPLPITE